jgi:hypothetical protein
MQAESQFTKPMTVRIQPEVWQRIRKVLKGGEVKSAFVREAVLAELQKREAESKPRRGAAL